MCNDITGYRAEHNTSFNDESITWADKLTVEIKSQQQTASKFQSQLLLLFDTPLPLEENEPLHQRVTAAVSHFTNELNSLLDFIQTSPAVTDSKIHAKEYNDNIKELLSQLSLKNVLLKGYTGSINIKSYQEIKKRFTPPYFSVNFYAGASTSKNENIAHPILNQQIRKLRDAICT